LDTISCQETYQLMKRLTTKHGMIRNFHQNVRMDNWEVETDLFPKEALEVYSAWNLEQDISSEDKKKYFLPYRGGSQGDYRDGMDAKISNVVACLTLFPHSKRAVITIPNNSSPVHTSDDDAKCLREIHFYLDRQQLNATAFFRAQAADIFPKNIHFIGALISEIAGKLDGEVKPGILHYHATTLVADRQ
jgi:thymidylate synthase